MKTAAETRRRIHLVLADGTAFPGFSIGASGATTGEAVFTTGMTGYQEVLTDPSYCGQLVAMTAPQMGNTGVNTEDTEAEKPHVAGFIVREDAVRHMRLALRWRLVPVDVELQGCSVAGPGVRDPLHAPAVDAAGRHMHQQVERDRVLAL